MRVASVSAALLLVAACQSGPGQDGSGPGTGGKADGEGYKSIYTRTVLSDAGEVVVEGKLVVTRYGRAIDFELEVVNHKDSGGDPEAVHTGYVEAQGLALDDDRATFAEEGCELVLDFRSEQDTGVVTIAQDGDCIGYAGVGVTFGGEYDYQVPRHNYTRRVFSEGEVVIEGSLTATIHPDGLHKYVDFEIEVLHLGNQHDGFIGDVGVPLVDGVATLEEEDCTVALDFSEEYAKGLITVTQTGVCAGFAGVGVAFGGEYFRDLPPAKATYLNTVRDGDDEILVEGRLDIATTASAAEGRRLAVELLVVDHTNAGGDPEAVETGMIVAAELAIIDGIATFEGVDCTVTFDVTRAAAYGVVEVTQAGTCDAYAGPGVTFDGTYVASGQ